jgi:protocatechuate 3,4-dioxygenase, alpha subunit
MRWDSNSIWFSLGAKRRRGNRQDLEEGEMSFQPTPSQTVGPFFSIGCDRLQAIEQIDPNISGEHVEIRGRVIDGDGVVVPDAMLELWQANGEGKYSHPEDTQDKQIDARFRGFGRVSTDEGGAFRILTIKPGAVPGPNGKPQAPHIVVSIFMRGLLRRLVTRIYFPGTMANDGDFVLSFVDPGRRSTLIARSTNQDHRFEWNVILQGQNETVFFDIGV